MISSLFFYLHPGEGREMVPGKLNDGVYANI